MANILSHIAPIAILLFLVITFSISIIEKFSDWKGTVAYISEAFKDTFVKTITKSTILILVFFEIMSVSYLTIGLSEYCSSVLSKEKYFDKENALIGISFSILTILYMLIGQRIAKDYPGATSLAIYFIICILGIFSLT